MIHVIAIITAKPGKRDEILRPLPRQRAGGARREGLHRVRRHGRHRRHGSFQTKFGPDTFVVVEKWESIDALKAHAAAPHMTAYARQDTRSHRQPRHPRPVAA